MEHDLISVALFGHPDPDIASKLLVQGLSEIEANNFNVSCHATDSDVNSVLVEARPHVVFSFGAVESFPNLFGASLELRRRWVHFEEPPSPAELANRALAVYIDISTRDRFADEPLISVFTPTYKTGERLLRPYRSLLAQSYRNWEWVVYDDSPDEETWAMLRALAKEEPRVRIFRSDGNFGVIGEVKRRLCGLARGKILVELDHDDELTDHCLADLVEAFAKFPDAGFAYSDCAEIFEDGELASYGPGWGFGFGSYRTEIYRGKPYHVTNYPSINAKTMRHIVGVPNHVRAWRTDAYHAIGGYAPEVHVADDYEILIRTFLHTRMVHIHRFGYIQYIQRDGGNTQRKRNKEIQRLVRLFEMRYELEIHERLLELGVDDFVWRNGGLDFSVENPDPAPIANYILP